MRFNLAYVFYMVFTCHFQEVNGDKLALNRAKSWQFLGFGDTINKMATADRGPDSKKESFDA